MISSPFCFSVGGYLAPALSNPYESYAGNKMLPSSDRSSYYQYTAPVQFEERLTGVEQQHNKHKMRLTGFEAKQTENTGKMTFILVYILVYFSDLNKFLLNNAIYCKMTCEMTT